MEGLRSGTASAPSLPVFPGFEQLINGALIGTWAWDFQTGGITINDAWAEIAGFSREELVPVNAGTRAALFLPEDRDDAKAALERYLSGLAPYYECQSRIRHRNGNPVWIHERGMVLTRTASGEPRLMAGLRLDVTATKKIQVDVEIGGKRMRFQRTGNKVVLRLGKQPRTGGDGGSAVSPAPSSSAGPVRKALQGELTFAHAPLLQESLAKEIDNGVRRVVFDMAETRFIDSMGISLLIAVRNSLEQVQGSVEVVNVSAEMMHLFRSLRLVDVLHVSGGGKDG